MKKFYSVLVASTFTAFNLFADPSDHVRILDESDGSDLGPVGMVIIFIIGVILVGFILSSIYSDKNQNSQDKGCLTIFFVVFIAIAFFALMSQCS